MVNICEVMDLFFRKPFCFFLRMFQFWVLCGFVIGHCKFWLLHTKLNMCYNQTGDISTLDGTSLKLVDKFTYLGSSISSTEKDIDVRLTKAWTAIDRLSIIWKSDLTDKMKPFLPGSGSVDTAVWMHYLDASKTAGEKAKRQLHKNFASNIEQVLAATPGIVVREFVLQFTFGQIPLGKVWTPLFSLQLWVNSRTD